MRHRVRRDSRTRRRAGAPGAYAAVLLGMVTSGCERGVPAGRAVTFAAAERTLTTLQAGAIWAVGGDPADTLLLLPTELVASEGVVFVLDTYGHRVSAFEPASGRLIWSRGRRGSGPADVDGPRAMEPAFGGGVAVADGGNARIARFSPTGETAAPIPIRGTPTIRGLCGLGDDTWLLTTLIPGERLLIYAPARDTIPRLDLPGPYGEGEAAIATQVQLAADGRGGCLLTYSLGAGFAWFEGGAFGPFRPYVEPLDLPTAEVQSSQERTRERIADMRPAALDATFVDDEVWILFGGATEDAGRLLDRYDRATGAYTGSLVLPSRAQKIAVDGERIYALVRRAGYPVLVAWPRPPQPAP